MRKRGTPFGFPYLTPGDTAEHIISARAGWLYGVWPNLTTTGTITFRNAATAAGGTAFIVCAIGLTQAGKNFGPLGVFFDTGITVQLSVASDLSMIVYEPLQA